MAMELVIVAIVAELVATGVIVIMSPVAMFGMG